MNRKSNLVAFDSNKSYYVPTYTKRFNSREKKGVD